MPRQTKPTTPPSPASAGRVTHAAQLFLSHSHRDKTFAGRLARDLSQLDVAVWLAEWEVAPGDSLHERVGAAIDAAMYVGIVLSPASVRSNWCLAELHQAMAREKDSGKNIVIPLLYRRVPLLPILKDRLHANFSRNYFAALVQVAAFLHGIPQSAIADNTQRAKPRTLADVKALLTDAGWKGTIHLGKRDWRQLQSILAKFGVQVDKEFVLLRTIDLRAIDESSADRVGRAIRESVERSKTAWEERASTMPLERVVRRRLC